MFLNGIPKCVALRSNKEDIMRKVLTLAIVMICVTLAGIQCAEALDVNIQAVVPGTCRFTSTAAVTISFPGLTFKDDGTLWAASVLDNSSVEYWCTKGRVPTALTAGGTDFTGGTTPAIASTLSDGADTIPYTYIFTDGGRGINDGPSVRTAISIQADIADGTAFDGAAGTYTDTVILTLTP